MKEINVRIHGDNIVECERALALIIDSFHPCNIEGPKKSIVNPEFLIISKEYDIDLNITFFPGYHRWKTDVLSFIYDQEGVLREAPDVIITIENGEYERVILAIEFSESLPAGNQSWQRSGRAYSLGISGIPYLYITKIGGIELGLKRDKKSIRFPNPAVGFSFHTHSRFTKIPIVQIYDISSEADAQFSKRFSSVVGTTITPIIIRKSILGEDFKDEIKTLENKSNEFIKEVSKEMSSTLDESLWDKIIMEIEKDPNSFLNLNVKKFKIKWSKTATLSGITDTAKKAMSISGELCYGISSKNLPFCVVSSEMRKVFASKFIDLYKTDNSDYIGNLNNWLNRDDPLTICWIAGFKPGGEDSRPDRGLVPFLRMLIGQDIDLLSVIYGPVPSKMLDAFKNNPRILIKDNGLWEAILKLSNAVVIDSSKNSDSMLPYLINSNIPKKQNIKGNKIFPKIDKTPKLVGENDVDSVLHFVFTGIKGKKKVFEGMCNPPGGDWSGLSLIDKNKEFRWLSLPRVAEHSYKRPDHVYEFLRDDKNILLIIESKANSTQVEIGIGNRLTDYVKWLLNFPPNAIRNLGNVEKWSGYNNQEKFGIEKFEMISCFAFMKGNNDNYRKICETGKMDIIISVEFISDLSKAIIEIFPTNETGKTFVNEVLESDIQTSELFDIKINNKTFFY